MTTARRRGKLQGTQNNTENRIRERRIEKKA